MELCQKILQIMHIDFKDYVHTFSKFNYSKLYALFSASIMFHIFDLDNINSQLD